MLAGGRDGLECDVGVRAVLAVPFGAWVVARAVYDGLATLYAIVFVVCVFHDDPLYSGARIPGPSDHKLIAKRRSYERQCLYCSAARSATVGISAAIWLTRSIDD